MSDALTRPEQMLMWELFAAGGAKLQKDIAGLTPATRTALAGKGLITAAKHGRTLQLELQDRGWRWIADSDPFPVAPDEKRVSAERRLLGSLIASLKRYAAGQETTLQALFRPAPKPNAKAPDALGRVARARPGNPADLPSKEGQTGVGQPTNACLGLAATVEDDIRTAFFTLAGRPARDNVRLSALRAALPGHDRAAVDATLLAMRKAGTANLMNLDNPRDIAAEAEAALSQGHHTFHVLWIDA